MSEHKQNKGGQTCVSQVNLFKHSYLQHLDRMSNHAVRFQKLKGKPNSDKPSYFLELSQCEDTSAIHQYFLLSFL